MYPRNIKKNSKEVLLEALNQSNTGALMKELLQFKGFDKAQIDGVFKVVHATPNPPVALQVILGLYKEPKFNRLSYLRNRECFFLGYEALEYEDSQISYTYREPVTQSCWYDPKVFTTTDEHGVETMDSQDYIKDNLQKEYDHDSYNAYLGPDKQNIVITSKGRLTTKNATCSPREWIRGLNDESNPVDLRTKLNTFSADPKSYELIPALVGKESVSVNPNWKR